MSLSLPIKRRFVQVASAVLLNSNFWHFGLERYCLPVMNCEACAMAWLGCPIGMMQASIAFMEFPFLVIGIAIFLGILFGRLLCGWVCPMGLLQDLLHKIPTPKFKIPKFMSWFKYVFLILTVLLIPLFLGGTLDRPFCDICPTAAIQVMVPTMITTGDFGLGGGVGLKLGILIVVLGLAVASNRFFCRVMCPMGALMALTNKISAFSIRVNPSDIKLKRILERASREVSAERCSLFLYDRKRQEICTKIAQDLEVEEIRLPIGVGICGHVAKTGEIINVPDAYKDRRFDPEIDAKTGYRTRSVLTVPVLDNTDSIVAVLQALNRRGGKFTSEDEAKLADAAARIAEVIWEAKSCVRCRRCDRQCPMDVPVMASQDEEKAVNRHTECIGCLTCEGTCPTSAIANNSRALRA